jgi:hypothetical protein
MLSIAGREAGAPWHSLRQCYYLQTAVLFGRVCVGFLCLGNDIRSFLFSYQPLNCLLVWGLFPFSYNRLLLSFSPSFPLLLFQLSILTRSSLLAHSFVASPPLIPLVLYVPIPSIIRLIQVNKPGTLTDPIACFKVTYHTLITVQYAVLPHFHPSRVQRCLLYGIRPSIQLP